MRGPVEPPGFAPTGRRMRMDGVDLWTMRDGRIARYHAFYDMTELARQLGIVPPVGSAPSGRWSRCNACRRACSGGDEGS